MRLSIAVLTLAVLAACNRDPKPDAYGNFEATEVVVSSETSGQIREFNASEGLRLARGAVVAIIDTTQLALEAEQIRAQRAATRSRGTEVAAQIRVLEVQREIARRTLDRTRRLVAAEAATAQQLDQAERDYQTLGAQIEAVRAQRQTSAMDVASANARVDQIRQRISRSRIVNPQAGTVLTTFARVGEIVQPGQPLYKIADLDTLLLRAYVTGDQLSTVRLGQSVDVKVDQGSGLKTISGTVAWVSATSEFTPTPIQTRDDRGDLVYAVKIAVPNTDGTLKIGMPGDVTLTRTVASAPRK